MESLSNIQEDIKSKILKAKTNFKKCPKDRFTLSYIETRLESLEQQWQLFHKTHVKIVSEIKKADLYNSSYHKDNVYDEVEEFYIQFKSDLKELLNTSKMIASEIHSSPGASSSKEVSNFRLPEVKIPVFSGKYIEWQPFRDLFVGLIHKNQRLDDAQKLYYLKGYLTGDAEQLLRNVSVTCDNYKTSWEKLESMFSNKKFLVTNILKRLFNQRVLTVESATDIKRLISTTSDCLGSLKNVGIDVASWDVLIIFVVTAKLDKDTRKAWEFKVASDPTDELPTFNQFSEFLISRYRGLENLETKVDRHPKSTQAFHVVKDKKVSCAYCSADHKISSCPKFGKENNGNRRKFVQENNLCFNCLNGNHSVRFCKITLRCQVCKRRHHSLLHPPGDAGSVVGEGSAARADNSLMKNAEKEVDSQEEELDKTLVSCFSTGKSKTTVLLTTALVKAESKNGSYRVVRALLDQGSQGSFVTESMVQYLGLNKIPSKNKVLGVGGDKSATSTSMVMVKIRSRVDPSFQLRVKAYVLKSVTTLLPATTVTKVEWVDLSDDELADPEYFRPNKIDILLGAEVYSQVIYEGIKKNVSDTVLAQDTALGWIFSGAFEVDNITDNLPHITVMNISLQDDMLKKFWELEAEPSGTKKMLTEDEIKCEDLFSATTMRNKDGRYIVRLPLREADPVSKLGESKGIAEKRLKGLEVRLEKNPKLKSDYAKVLQEYLDLDHMVKVEEKESSNKAIYLPHHAVVREDRETTKIRVVFDASCKGTKGRSLNDELMVGPPLQSELRHTIMRLRSHKICLIADIVKMYRQVLVNRLDTPFQRILWRDGPEKEVQEYELITVTFGTASAPYLAVKSLQQLAYDECQDCPDIAKIILRDFYMDDLMTGSDNIESSFNIYTELTNVLSKGGFQIQKWKSNCQELLEKIHNRTNGKDDGLNIRVDDTTKILGLTWNPSGDFFHYSVNLTPLVGTATKRKIVSDISRLFDPLGWLAPSIILAKILIQKLWLAGIEWDQEVPSNLLQEWVTYRQNLTSLVEIKIPRWLNTCNKDKRELHGFSDASKVAYAAVVYLRIVDEKGNIHVSLVTSKTKVAPIKQVSIPRLELCAAVLLAKLMVEVAEVMGIQKDQLHAFTDSEVVLAWLNNHPCRWKTFVGNRVSDILLTLDTHHWSHVSTKQNPADCASRGISPAELATTSIWFEGPAFLKQDLIVFKKPKHLVTNLEHVRVQTAVFDVKFWDRFSSFSKLVRVVAYCRRWLNLRKKTRSVTTYLSKKEIEDAIEVCVKRCQEERFSEELEELQGKGILDSKKKKLKSLNVFLDSEGIIRVGGRLEMSSLTFNEKHPILIPKESFLTGLLIAEAHQKTMHGGPQLMITYLRSRYWIVGVKALVKKFYRQCVTCVRYTAKATSQLMGQMPSSRVTPNKPFLITGVDYAGPINLRVTKGRGNKSYKGYVALFVCLSTRAIHLEAVSELSTQGFLAAFRRFVARRGRCAELYSDNGTNFVGAARELLCLFNEEKSNFKPELAEYLANNGTNWNFIPPRAPHFGGLWEAGIKSMKFHLKRVIGNSMLTYEEMATVLSQIEACLNTRPMSSIEDQNELLILTPGHFLVGEPLVIVPESNYEIANIHSLRRWQLHQRMMQDFWRRWSQDYLHQFLQRNKWQYQKPEPSVGDVVLIKEDDMPPGKWLLGKVEQKHPGPDNITRVVTIRTKNSLIKRPTSKLAVLPITK